MKEITSLGNAVVKDVCNLKQKKYRERSGSFVVERMLQIPGWRSFWLTLPQKTLSFTA